MSGYKKQKVFIYKKDGKNELVETCESIAKFKEKYFSHYNKKSNFPLFWRNGYVDIGDKLATLKVGGREVYKQYLIDINEYTIISSSINKDYKIDVFNLKNEKLASFKNIRVAEKMTGINRTTIYHQCCTLKMKKEITKSGLIFKKGI